MSLLKCSKCQYESTTKFEKCPNCGTHVNEKSRFGVFGTVVCIIVALIMFNNISDYFKMKSEEKEKQAQAKIATQIKKEQKEIELLAIQKEMQEKSEFESTIEIHYQKLLTAYKEENKEDITNILNLFTKFGRTNYKDVAQYKKKISIKNLEEKAKSLPSSETIENLSVYRQLLELDPSNNAYKKKVALYDSEMKKKMKRDAQVAQKANSDLELLSWTWRSEYDYAIAEGQVKNISGNKLEKIEALVTWYDSNGTMITSDSSLIEYNPIMPGQISPFKVMQRFNPLMKNATLEFKFMWGNQISTYYEKD